MKNNKETSSQTQNKNAQNKSASGGRCCSKSTAKNAKTSAKSKE